VTVSVVVSWRDRRELSQSLPTMVDALRGVGGEIVVVNFSGDEALLGSQVASTRDSVRLVHVDDQQYFNKSCAQNIGAAHSAHPLLFFCDCDILLEQTALSSLAEQLAADGNAFATLFGVRETERNSRGAGHVIRFGYELHLRTLDGRSLHIVDHEEDAIDGTRQAPGLLMVRREHFLRIGGYNSRLHGWGWEDQDMIARLTLGAGLRRVMSGRAMHISHDDTCRTAHYPLANRWESRDRMFRQALANYDRADFQGTYHDDVARTPVRCDDATAQPA
jgi:hypothetical protein